MKQTGLIQSFFNAKLPLWLVVLSFSVSGFVVWQSWPRHSIEMTQNAGVRVSTEGHTNSLANQNGEKVEDKRSFRQVISDMAWGRNRNGKNDSAKAPHNSSSDVNSQNTNSNAETTPKIAAGEKAVPMNDEQMQMMVNRMQYCAQHWQTDPSCGRSAPQKK